VAGAKSGLLSGSGALIWEENADSETRLGRFLRRGFRHGFIHNAAAVAESSAVLAPRWRAARSGSGDGQGTQGVFPNDEIASDGRGLLTGLLDDSVGILGLGTINENGTNDHAIRDRIEDLDVIRIRWSEIDANAVRDEIARVGGAAWEEENSQESVESGS